MVNFEHETARQLASDIRSTHQSIDNALADLASLTFSVIDVCRNSDAPPAHTQAAIEGVANGLTMMVDARKGFVNAHRKIAVAQRDSNLQEINFGCVGPGPLLQPAGLRVVNGGCWAPLPGCGLYSEDGQGMDILQSAFVLALLLCALYAGINGGRTGRAGAAIFIVATILSAAAATMNPSWATTSYGLFAVDGGCLLALLVLAMSSNRFWPIWAMGFQTVAVATHMATLWIPDFVPKSYQALLSFWAIPILWVMVMGTRKDRQYERRKVQLA